MAHSTHVVGAHATTPRGLCAAAAGPILRLPLDPALSIGTVAATGPPASTALVFDIKWFESRSASDLLQALQILDPPPSQTAAIMYEASDLIWAEALEADELAAEYQPPEASFRAGLGLARTAVWDALIGANTELQRWVHHGYSEFMGTVPLPCISRPNSHTTAGANSLFVDSAVSELVAVEAVLDVTRYRADPNTVRVIAPLTVATKGTKQRLCWNGRCLNLQEDGQTARLPTQQFKLEHAELAARLMRKGDYMFTLDMKAGYHQIPVNPWWRKFLCFEWENSVYQWQVLPFGLSTAPRAYSKLTRALLTKWRREGVRCSNFLDDFIFFAHSLEEAIRLRTRVLADMTALGWFLSPAKCMLRPGTRLIYLGYEFCSLPVPHLRVPHAKVMAFREQLRPVLRRYRQALQEGGIQVSPVSMRGVMLAALVGKLQSFRLAVPVVPLLTRALYACLNQLPLQPDSTRDFQAFVHLTTEALEECQFWVSRLSAWNGCALTPVTVSRVLYTDASTQGFGGLVHRVQGRQMGPAVLQISEYWDNNVDGASVLTEVMGLWRALVAAREELSGQVVLHRTDNMCTYCVVKNGGSQRSERLTHVVRRILIFCLAYDITLSSQYVGAAVIIRSGADALSRVDDVSDCSLNPGVFRRLWYAFGPFHVDRFASANSVQPHPHTGADLPYFSMFADSRCMGIDGLTADWRGVTNYAFPPVSLVGPMLRLLHEQGASALVIVPAWPSQWWWPILQSMGTGQPQVELTSLLTEGELFHGVRPGGPTHPLHNYQHPQSVKWLAVWVSGTTRGQA